MTPPPHGAAPALASTDVADEVHHRRLRIQGLRDLGIDPFPAKAFAPTHTVPEVASGAARFMEACTELRLAGRISGYRDIGRAVFVDLLDEGERLQLYLSAATLGADWPIAGLLDVGDHIGVTGSMFLTRAGEKTLEAHSVTVLSKATHPLPLGKRDRSGVVHQALADTGRLLRERHVNLIVDDKLRQRMIQRDRILREVRKYFQDSGFVEIETPVLSRYYGGAAAQPFETHADALDSRMFLRVSPECHLKRALCGGMNKVFEIGKNFRNEGIDHSHNPEFTALEWYESCSDYIEQMVRFETLVSRLALAVHHSTMVHFKGQAIDFAPPWPRLRVLDLVAEELRLPAAKLTEAALAAHWKTRGVEGPRPSNWGEYLMAIFEAAVEPNLRGPVFITDHPVEVSPLTKRHRRDPRLVERFEPFVLGMEIGNAYSELNDSDEQRRRLERQDVVRDERYGLDEDFLRALEHGMPQAGGAGLGLDRIIMILTDSARLSDVILYPAV
jgi:lysyl-tRNA synthetase class 2